MSVCDRMCIRHEVADTVNFVTAKTLRCNVKQLTSLVLHAKIKCRFYLPNVHRCTMRKNNATNTENELVEYRSNFREIHML